MVKWSRKIIGVVYIFLSGLELFFVFFASYPFFSLPILTQLLSLSLIVPLLGIFFGGLMLIVALNGKIKRIISICTVVVLMQHISLIIFLKIRPIGEAGSLLNSFVLIYLMLLFFLNKRKKVKE